MALDAPEKLQQIITEEEEKTKKLSPMAILVIAVSTELENSIENLTKSGMKGVRYCYPDFGMFMSINEM